MRQLIITNLFVMLTFILFSPKFIKQVIDNIGS